MDKTTVLKATIAFLRKHNGEFCGVIATASAAELRIYIITIVVWEFLTPYRNFANENYERVWAHSSQSC